MIASNPTDFRRKQTEVILGRRPQPLIRSVNLLLLLLFSVCQSRLGFTQDLVATNTDTRVAALTAEMEQAMQKVRAIVNQPVKRYLRQPGMPVGKFSPGWFHEGAMVPDFSTVDVRATQEFPYDRYPYVTSDLNPGIVFIGRELEFNSMTKYFYTDRTVPKKRLTEAEMLEINHLYRIIGRCKDELRRLLKPDSPDLHPAALAQREDFQPEPERKPFYQRIPRSNYIKGGLGIAAVLVLYGVHRIVRR